MVHWLLIDYLVRKLAKHRSFRTKSLSIKLSKLLRHYIIQSLVVLGDIVNVAVVADGLEKSIIANKYPLCMGKH